MTLSNGARVLVIVPAYNEETNICAVIDQLAEYPQYDVLVVNDASTDRTPLLLSQKEVRHVDLVANLGIGGGVQTVIFMLIGMGTISPFSSTAMASTMPPTSRKSSSLS